jgi:CheY-like chemotaxis protein
VHREPGRGSTFTLYLPASHETAPPNPRLEVPPGESIVGGNETILVVEDEEMLREMACEILEAGGYRILKSASGREALDTWHKHRDEIDLVLTDMVMPEGMSGTELAEQLVAENPQIKIVFMSGYTANEISPELLQRLNAAFIAKPYGHVELSRIIRQALDQSVAPGLAAIERNH